MHCSLSLSLALSVQYLSASPSADCVPAFVCPSVCLLCNLQVIYKKFNVPCPFVDFAFNATSLNVSATDPGGEDDPACIPKMANLNSQVGLRMLHSIKLLNSPPLPWPLTDTHLCHSHLQHAASDSSQFKHGNLTQFKDIRALTRRSTLLSSC